MDSKEEAILAIFIGILIATFLYNTGCVLQAIEVYEECLIILHSQVLSIDSLLANICSLPSTWHWPVLTVI